MATVTPRLLSGSTNGRGIKVAAIAATGTLLHTTATATGAGTFDEIYLWAQNLATTNKLVTIEFGGTNASDRIRYTVPSLDGLHLLVPGLRLNGGVSVRVFAATASVVMIQGYVNRVA